ncbi:hypothetical protein MHY87_14785 [Microvirga sp. ACRRW]|uniref:hypothetical protein n=1 Tax=Microvirga sp. ACRRW TaxID=2918205 RepID=UPI001EF4D17A|nr:hypothetical protein [Microvirga sp. ACRRW]MCG7394172.1 hypothetical protein [Microvirga sp. ACRRW]
MHHSSDELSPKPASQDAEQADDNVIRFVPRSRPVPEKPHEPPQPDNDDPGPSAA